MAVATLSSALAGLVLAVGAQAKSLHPDYQLMRGEVQQYGDWLVGCDNQAGCTMIGFPPTLATRELDVAANEMAIQISLTGPADATPVVELVPFGIDFERKGTAASGGPFVLNVDYDGAASSTPHEFSRQALLQMEADAVIKHLTDDRQLVGKALSNGKAVVRFPEAEFKRAYNAMQRRRAELLKESADKAIDELPGELPDGSSTPSPEKHRRLSAMPHIVSGFAPILANSLCKHSFMQDMHFYRFTNGTDLWSYACDDGYPAQTYWHMASNGRNSSVPLSLPEPRDGKVDAGSQGLENAVFDFDFGILREYKLQNSRQDCGTFRAWGYTDNGWQLVERREMPLCKGLRPNDWIRTHYTPTDGTGPDE